MEFEISFLTARIPRLMKLMPNKQIGSKTTRKVDSNLLNIPLFHNVSNILIHFPLYIKTLLGLIVKRRRKLASSYGSLLD